MANRGKRGGSAAALSNSSTPSPSATPHATTTASSSTAGTTHTPPASVWGKGGLNPLTATASHTPATNGMTAADKGKEKSAATSGSTSTTPITAAASSTASPSATATAAHSSPTASAAASSSSASSTSSTAPATSTPSTSVVSASSTPTPVSSLSTICQLGNTVHVTTPLGERLEGVVYVYDAAAHILALELTSPSHATVGTARDYTLLNTHNLHITLAHKPATPTPRRHLPPVDHGKLQQREGKALASRAAEAAKIGQNVTSIAQRLFDALAKLYEARWDGTAIVLLGVLRLEEPYGAEQLTGGSVQQRQRIVKTIEAQREKEERK